MPVRTLLELSTEVRQRANLENSDNFLTDAEVTRAVNQSIRAWRDLLIENQGQDFFINTVSVTLDGSASYALSEVYQIVGVSYDLNGDDVPIKPYNFADRGRFSSAVGQQYPSRYRYMSGNLHILPVVSSGTVTVTYIPYQFELAGDEDFLEVFNGWDEWIVLDAAMKALEKENTDVSQLHARREATERRLISQAQFQDRGMPETVADVYDADIDWNVGYVY